TRTLTRTITPTFTTTRTPTITNTPAVSNTPCPNSNYTTSTTTGASILPGTTDVGVHCDECTGTVNFPFPVQFYSSSYTSANVSSNGSLQFTVNDSIFGTSCPLPWPGPGAAIFLYQEDLRTDGAGDGIFTAVYGTAPNRQFVIEWRTSYYNRA